MGQVFTVNSFDFPDAVILNVDLRLGSMRREIIPGRDYRLYPGGSALAARLLLEKMNPGTDALSPDNTLVFAVSPFTGLPAAGLSRIAAAAKSPLTGGIGDSQAGGFLPAEFAANGISALVISGRSEHPAYLHIANGNAEIRPAGHIWGATTGDGEDIIREELGRNVEIAQIGPAGEKLVRFACVVHNCSRANGRTGIGAVMGSKNLRALVVSRARKPSPADPDAFGDINRRAGERLEDPFWKDFRDRGTPGNLEPLRDMGYLPTNNFKSGWLPGFKGIDIKGGGKCYACPLECKRIAEKSPDVEPRYGGPEYETIAAVGSYCGITSGESINISNQICNMYGMDTISCGATISFAIECFAKGLISEGDVGMKLSFGDSESVHRLMMMIAHREGIGDILAEGSKRAAMIIGGDARDLVPASKGQELPAHMPQLKPSLALIYAVNPGGADHQSSEHDTMLYAQEGTLARKWLSSLGVSYESFRSPGQGKTEIDERRVRFALLTQRFYSLLDTLCMCQFVWGPSWQALGPEDILDLASSGIGWRTSLDELMEIGERKLDMMRHFNAREGFTKKDDTLPNRFFDPLPDGPSKGARVDRRGFDEAKELYYALAGWDESTGNPTPEKLKSLSLEWLTPTAPETMSAVVLAGGRSRRMGKDKALLEWEGKNFLETILETLSMFPDVMISAADSESYKDFHGKIVADIYRDAGPIGGIYSSLAVCEHEYLFVTACDTPLLSARLARGICRAAEGYQCCVARESNGRVHSLCGVYHKSMIPILKEQIENSRRKIALSYDKIEIKYFDLSAEQAAELRNFNTEAEYTDLVSVPRRR
jgi:aldehyde:ferredoxin oxidoreductase